MKKTILICLFGYAVAANASPVSVAEQRQDIQSLLNEIDYLIEVSKQLQQTYGGDQSKVRFNYPALIAQLTAARDGVQAYLNLDVFELHNAPPVPLKPDLTRIQ